ncbi:MAG TPA: VCBS repeat-containing protein, partial [Bacteroidia bacterium]|nr:VCBS repeat-containing protein [Bacteroidia bacterium]
MYFSKNQAIQEADRFILSCYLSPKDIVIFVVNSNFHRVKKLKFLFIMWVFLIVGNRCLAQPYFLWNDSIKVSDSTHFYANPWAGGLNFIQPSNIDLDQDGIKDLFIFDRTGNKVRTFIKKSPAGSAAYYYDPSFENKFPLMNDWVLLADYNCDGKEDIFCYSSIGAGVDIYKNTSTPSTGLQFQKVVTQQLSAYYPDAPPSTFCSLAKRCNLYISSV